MPFVRLHCNYLLHFCLPGYTIRSRRAQTTSVFSWHWFPGPCTVPGIEGVHNMLEWLNTWKNERMNEGALVQNDSGVTRYSKLPAQPKVVNSYFSNRIFTEPKIAWKMAADWMNKRTKNSLVIGSKDKIGVLKQKPHLWVPWMPYKGTWWIAWRTATVRPGFTEVPWAYGRYPPATAICLAPFAAHTLTGLPSPCAFRFTPISPNYMGSFNNTSSPKDNQPQVS